jgi:DNA-directed RNA polymerase specialized sigma24 family protein
MTHDPAITSDDLMQDFEVDPHAQGACVAKATYVRRREIDAARRYTRHGVAALRMVQRIEPDPVSQLISEERARIVQEALRHATPPQRNVAKLLMSGLRRCDIAKHLGVTRSAVSHALQRLGPLLLHAK